MNQLQRGHSGATSGGSGMPGMSCAERTVCSSNNSHSHGASGSTGNGKVTFYPKPVTDSEQHAATTRVRASKERLGKAKRKLNIKGSLLDEICLDSQGKPYLPQTAKLRSPEPRKSQNVPLTVIGQQESNGRQISLAGPLKVMKMMCSSAAGGLGLRTAFSSPVLWTTQQHQNYQQQPYQQPEHSQM